MNPTIASSSRLATACLATAACKVLLRLALAGAATLSLAAIVPADDAALRHGPPKVAALVTVYYHNSHADVIVSRLMQTLTLDGKGARPDLKLASLYIDQPKASQLGLGIAREHGVPVFKTASEALTLGGRSLAVDGVLLIGEHGSYPLSASGQMMYPKRRLFGQVLEVFDRSGRVVPVFSDKHLADNWEDAKWIYDSARRRGIPLMAGSSLPTLWRHPPVDLRRGARVKEIVATSYGHLEAYGFHALEMIECLVEHRAGGETGVRSVQMISGKKVWEAARGGVFSKDLLEAALSRCTHSNVPSGDALESGIQDPVLFSVNYCDGLRASVFWAPRQINEWTVAWRDEETRKIAATQFWTQEARPFMHFSYLLGGIERMIHTGKPSWPVERTLLTTGVLHGLFVSKKEGGRLVDTPYLDVHYQSDWNWHEPPPPPPGRPVQGQ